MRHSSLSVALALLAFPIIQSCKTSTPTAPKPGSPLADHVLATDAVVRYVPIETGCWVLHTRQGGYEPINLPSQYEVDGLPVHVVIRAQPGWASICMIAPMVSIDSIRTR